MKVTIVMRGTLRKAFGAEERVVKELKSSEYLTILVKFPKDTFNKNNIINDKFEAKVIINATGINGDLVNELIN